MPAGTGRHSASTPFTAACPRPPPSAKTLPMANPSDALLRRVLGPSQQIGAARAVGLLAAFSFVGALAAWLFRRAQGF